MANNQTNLTPREQQQQNYNKARSNLLLMTVLSAMLGVQFLALGLLGELGTRIFYEVRGGEPYAIRETLNFEAAHAAIRRAA